MSEKTPGAELTRGEKMKRTRAANAAKKAAEAAVKKPLPLTYLQDLLSSLDEAEQALMGYAEIKSIKVTLEIEHAGQRHSLSATHDGNNWTLDNLTV